MWMSTQSQMNQTRTWTRKTAMGSHRKRKDVDHAAITPSSMHSEMGSKNIVIGVDAACSFLHLKVNEKCVVFLHIKLSMFNDSLSHQGQVYNSRIANCTSSSKNPTPIKEFKVHVTVK